MTEVWLVIDVKAITQGVSVEHHTKIRSATSAMSKDMYEQSLIERKFALLGRGRRRLLSVGKFAERGMSVKPQCTSCVIWDKSKEVTSGKKVGKLWYTRRGHFNEDLLTKPPQATTGLPKTQRIIITLIGGYMKGKQTVTHFPSRLLMTTTRPLELVHTDVIDPKKSKSKGGAIYVLVFANNYSRYLVAYFLKKKSEVGNKFKTYLTMYENQ
ncbi:hypothetical protein PHMEG_0002525 [Phytophthora megakarya]|uniref:Uncharacterized protein n=1 Tax=Phytophthora megakarya TaxID=4795 RepID=A0A225X0H6_9STRA|nr:hypothetical protein PHMEG_0002525 [Phytophthora megakarya]